MRDGCCIYQSSINRIAKNPLANVRLEAGEIEVNIISGRFLLVFGGICRPLRVRVNDDNSNDERGGFPGSE